MGVAINNTQKHLGENIRKIRLLKGMKQDTFAKEMGIAQQNVSKMERKKELTDDQLKKAAEVLKTSVEAIKNFDERIIINNNVFSKDQINHPITEIITYFKGELERVREELDSKNRELEKLKAQLAKTSSFDSQNDEDKKSFLNIQK